MFSSMVGLFLATLSISSATAARRRDDGFGSLKCSCWFFVSIYIWAWDRFSLMYVVFLWARPWRYLLSLDPLRAKGNFLAMNTDGPSGIVSTYLLQRCRSDIRYHLLFASLELCMTHVLNRLRPKIECIQWL